MNFLTAEVEVVVDYSKLKTQLDKVKQEVMKSTTAMEKSYHKQNQAIEVVNKSLVATAVFTRKIFGQTIRVEKVLGRWSTTAWNFYRKMTRNLLVLGKVWSVAKNVAITLAKPLIWFSKEMYAGFRETKHFGKTIKEIEKSAKGISEEYKFWSMADIVLHPIKAWKALKGAAKEGAGAIDMAAESTKKYADEIENLNEKMAEQGIIMTQYGDAFLLSVPKIEDSISDQVREASREMDRLTHKMYDVSGVMVEAYKKVYDTIKWVFGGIRDVASLVFGNIFRVTKWRAAGITAVLVGMYYKVTQAAMDAEDALSMEELGPTRTILQQMRDAFASIAAVIGKPLLTNIRLIASALTDWVERSRPQIKAWAEKITEKIRYAQLAFVDWVKFLTTDFKGGVTVALKVVSELFKGFADALIILMDFAGRRAGKALVDAFRGVVTNLLPSLVEEMDKKLKWLGQKLMKSSEHAARRMERLTGIPAGRPEFRDIRLGARAATEEESASAAILRVYRERAENIKAILAGMPTWGSTEIAAAEVAEKQIKKSALIMQATGDAMAQHRAKMLEQGGTLAEMELRLSLERINQMMEEDFFARFQRGVAQMKVDFITWGDIGQTVAETMKSSFADAFYAMTTEGRKWKDAMKSFARDVLIAIQKSLAARAATMIMTGAVGPVMGWLGGLLGGGAAPTQATGINPTASPVEGLQHGGEVLKTGLAVVHKGETFSGIDKGAPKVEVNVINKGRDLEIESYDEFAQMDEHVVNIVVRDIVAGGKLATLTGAG